jgi:hypothetical protein
MHLDLLDQAEELAKREGRGRPKQASLRRAVSSAYYSLFHYVTRQACELLLGTHPERIGFRRALARAFEHGGMKEACNAFTGGPWPVGLMRTLPAPATLPPELRRFARTFVEIQEKRHAADYDLSTQFDRADVLALVSQVRRAMNDFDAVSDAAWKQFFTVSLLTWKTMKQR